MSLCRHIIVLILLTTPVCGANMSPRASLFFTPQEESSIETAVRRAQPKLLGQAKHVLHCGSIMYIDETRWIIWLQGERWTPETKRHNLHVIAVTPHTVRLSLAMAGETSKREVTLRPHQSLNLLTGNIIEGIY